MEKNHPFITPLFAGNSIIKTKFFILCVNFWTGAKRFFHGQSERSFSYELQVSPYKFNKWPEVGRLCTGVDVYLKYLRCRRRKTLVPDTGELWPFPSAGHSKTLLGVSCYERLCSLNCLLRRLNKSHCSEKLFCEICWIIRKKAGSLRISFDLTSRWESKFLTCKEPSKIGIEEIDLCIVQYNLRISGKLPRSCAVCIFSLIYIINA